MKLRLLFATVAVSFVLASSSSAITWVDRDPDSGSGPLKFLTESSKTYSSTFNILEKGYNPATMLVQSATVKFAFADDSTNDPEEYVNIYLDNTLLVANLEVDGTHPLSSYAWYQFSVTGAHLASLQDGILDYKVKLQNTSGTNDTYLKITQLDATGTTRSVPDHGSAIPLFALGLVSLASLRHYRNRVARSHL